jgi:hypothetical protein
VHTTGAAEATQEPTLTQREGERRGERRGGRKKEKKDRKEREELQEKNIGHAMLCYANAMRSAAGTAAGASARVRVFRLREGDGY